jgi:protein-S-isoprenylcysteine O-methyltransferase Ste14
MARKHFLELKIPPLVVFFVFAAFMRLLAMAVPLAGCSLHSKKPIAAVIAAVGGVFAGAGILSFIRTGTTVNPTKPDKSSTLVTTGVYALTRNPMYLSLLFLLVGWVVYLSNISTLVLIPFFVAYINRFQIMPEERALSSLFGKEYEAYCEKVKRWL